MSESAYDPVDTMVDAKCVCCQRAIRVDYYDEAICKRCEDSRQHLLDELDELDELRREVRELRAELTKFHECDETSACHDDEGMLHTLRAAPGTSLSEPLCIRKVYHKDG
jgi:hypothetical protein